LESQIENFLVIGTDREGTARGSGGAREREMSAPEVGSAKTEIENKRDLCSSGGREKEPFAAGELFELF
jgi:hypothetical protein